MKLPWWGREDVDFQQPRWRRIRRRRQRRRWKRDSETTEVEKTSSEVMGCSRPRPSMCDYVRNRVCEDWSEECWSLEEKGQSGRERHLFEQTSPVWPKWSKTKINKTIKVKPFVSIHKRSGFLVRSRSIVVQTVFLLTTNDYRGKLGYLGHQEVYFVSGREERIKTWYPI